MAHAMADQDVTWFEEPVSSDDPAGLREVRDQVTPDVTAGEYGYDLAYSTACWKPKPSTACKPTSPAAAVSPASARSAPCAKPSRCPLSAHCAPQLHAHVACAVAPLRHVEYFHDHVRIDALLFDGALAPDGGALRPDQHRPRLGAGVQTPPTPSSTAWLDRPSVHA